MSAEMETVDLGDLVAGVPVGPILTVVSRHLKPMVERLKVTADAAALDGRITKAEMEAVKRELAALGFLAKDYAGDAEMVLKNWPAKAPGA